MIFFFTKLVVDVTIMKRSYVDSENLKTLSSDEKNIKKTRRNHKQRDSQTRKGNRENVIVTPKEGIMSASPKPTTTHFARLEKAIFFLF